MCGIAAGNPLMMRFQFARNQVQCGGIQAIFRAVTVFTWPDAPRSTL